MGGAMHQLVQLVEHLDVLAGAPAVFELVHAPHHQLGADATRRAKAAAFVGKKLGKVARYLEHVAPAVKHHEGTCRGHILKADMAAEIGVGQADPGGSAHLHRLGVAGAAVFQNTAYARAHRVLVQTGAFAVARHRMDFGAGGLRRTDPGPPVPAIHRNMGGSTEGLDVVDGGGLAQVTCLYREGRAYAGRAALALQRFDQRRFFAADIGTGADVDFNIKVKADSSLYVIAQQMQFAAALQYLLQRFQQIAVLAAQIDKALARAHHQRSDGHALKYRIGIAAQQHPVLEGSGLALVGIAHHIVGLAIEVAAQLPLGSGGKTGPTAPT